jgi:hypothetical protein
LVDIPSTAEQEILLEKPYDASDVEEVSKARKKSGRNRRARLDFVQGMMTLPEGRKYLWELLEKCFVFGNPVVVGDTHLTYMNLGQQNIGKMVLQDVQEFSDLYLKMVEEAKGNR